jgi:trimeric autotransporter adhesin
MKPLIKFKKTTLLVIPLALACFALLPSAQAVTPELLPSPTPDGGYPGHNTAEGFHALFNRTTGVWDSAFGDSALFHDTTGTANTALGYNALFNNLGGNGNTANGTFTLFSNTSGASNTALGNSALYKNLTGNSNTAMGANALHENTAGSANIAVGQGALLHNTDGVFNTAVGYQALLNNVGTTFPDGVFNTATGAGALFSNTNGNNNTATGAGALFSNTNGNNNTATGFEALFANNGYLNTATGSGALFENTTGSDNTATGNSPLFNNTTGSDNTATGLALYFNTTGSSNTATGTGALYNNTTGNYNTAEGAQALEGHTTGSFNIALGGFAGFFLITGSNNIDIGNIGRAEGNTIRIGNAVATSYPDGTTHLAQTRTFIAGIRGRTTGNANAIPVLIDSAGQLGTASSSRRFKNDIKSMDKVSEAILALKPVTFHYKSDNTGTPQFGLIAEDVAKVNPDLVVRDDDGKIYTVRYDAVNAMLLNEFLKAHHRIEEQDKRIEQLTAQLKQQAALIQKVNDKVELSKTVPQTVLNNQ